MSFRANEPAEMSSLFDGMLASLPLNKTLMTIKSVVNWNAVRQALAPMYKVYRNPRDQRSCKYQPPTAQPASRPVATPASAAYVRWWRVRGLSTNAEAS